VAEKVMRCPCEGARVDRRRCKGEIQSLVSDSEGPGVMMKGSHWRVGKCKGTKENDGNDWKHSGREVFAAGPGVVAVRFGYGMVRFFFFFLKIPLHNVRLRVQNPM
jgi:hypothetical protein